MLSVFRILFKIEEIKKTVEEPLAKEYRQLWPLLLEFIEKAPIQNKVFTQENVFTPDKRNPRMGVSYTKKSYTLLNDEMFIKLDEYVTANGVVARGVKLNDLYYFEGAHPATTQNVVENTPYSERNHETLKRAVQVARSA